MQNLNLNRLLVITVIIFALGIIAGNYTNISLQISVCVVGVLFLLALIFYFYQRRFLKLIIYILIFLLGIVWVDWYDYQGTELGKWEQENILVAGKVTSFTNTTNQIVFQVSKINDQNLYTQPKILIRTEEKNESFQWGDMVNFRGVLLKTSPRTNPGGFSEEEYWRLKGIKYKLSSFGQGQIIYKASGFWGVLNSIRQNIYNKVTKILPREECGVILGLILGDKSQIDADFYNSVQRLGIAHIFAVSGLHVGFLLALYLALSRYFRLSHSINILGAFIILGLYSLLTGLSPSVVRASIMAILTLLSFKWLRFKDFYTILAFAALVILIINPLNLFTIGFQLSFITTWGIFYLFPMAQKLIWIPKKELRNALAVPIAAQLAALPIVIYHFNVLSFYAPLINLLIVPLVGILIPLIFIGLILSFLWLKLAEPLLYLAGGIIYLLQVFLKKIPAGYMYLPQPAILTIVIYYCILLSFKEREYFKNKLSLNARFFITLVLIMYVFFKALPGTGALELTFLDVGQGDGAVLQTPYHQYVVIDGGPGESTVFNYLKHKGVNEVPLIILSHPDHDHINGLFTVLRNIETNYLLVPPNVENTPELVQLKELAKTKKVEIIEGQAGRKIILPSRVTFQVDWPSRENLTHLDVNNASLVVHCSYGQQDILFTGDIDSTVMRQLAGQYKDIELLKVPHHGSKNSLYAGLYSKFVSDAAVISVGRTNRYGHPHQSVVDALADSGIQTFRTDKMGAVIFKLGGKEIIAETILKDARE